jgi:hypothetical protein
MEPLLVTMEDVGMMAHASVLPATWETESRSLGSVWPLREILSQSQKQKH